ncbi:DUF4268 domain-containing protein [Niabella soli]|uniref:DUF4268 domain-containing protein n=1 Tax=Niabella soli DSM 19437 TaxID=929713 RepID=W0F0K4_9BACT|nr:DUF4268 domain-containing protein [Niabella soli]AHF14866.1 hypothetical protein NIASO_06255 [Niabella soli DSM 19437]
MYSKNEASLLKKEFWTAFGTYMKPIPSASGQFINWVNYKTGIKHLYFRADVTKRQASVSVEIVHSDNEERATLFEKLSMVQSLFAATTSGEWFWQPEVYDENGQPISRIIIVKENLNIFNKADWPGIISFLKEQLTGLDAFWILVKDSFEV